jgi:hypothetical protein
MTGERQTNFLRWRYQDCPLQKYTILGLLEEGGKELLGYAVLYSENRWFVIADLLYPSLRATRDDLLAGVLAWSRVRGAISVCCPFLGGRHLEEGMRRFGFHPRGAGRVITYLSRAGFEPPLRREAQQDLYFLLGDEDYNS